MKTNPTCANCGKPLTVGALEGICPECMFKVGMESAPSEHFGPSGTRVVSCSDPAPPISLGEEFGGYRILRRLGHGGMGVVYEAEERESGRRVALKVISQKLGSPADRARFLREGRLAASVNHPNCVYVFGTEEIDGVPVITMEFVSGGTLEQRVSANGSLPVEAAVDAVLQVIAGLEAAQAVGILHRDIKPSNCFECADGSVKVGDFGLSISTSARAETNITESGALVGTPAFCSPEQLRGEELSVRSDIYAVGVTLFYLLTGKVPFEGGTMPQLVANTLEKRAPSPRQLREEIPNGLARVILRCLDKQPGERFKSYTDLRRALEPYTSVAPSPATLGLRGLAGLTDFLLLSAFGQVIVLLFLGDPFTVLDQLLGEPGKMYLVVLPVFALAISYYAVSEWRWGATLGKALCRLRVVQEDRSFPALSRSFLRASIFTLVPVLPYWVFTAGDPAKFLGSTGYLLGLSFYAILALLFVTARRRNGFSAVHDLVTKTRVVSRTALESRPQLSTTEARPAEVEMRPTVGPYHVLEELGTSAEAEWLMGYDMRLLRRVLIRMVPAGTPALPRALKHVSRVGRLRWLTGRREGEANWDAFEGSAGQALSNLIAQPQPWAQVRFWLNDIATELSAAEQDQSVPEKLGLDRVWITSDGRAKLLDFPAPGTSGENGVATPAPGAGACGRSFLERMANWALSGNEERARSIQGPTVPLPLHARTFLETLPAMGGAGQVAAALKPLLRRPAAVTRLKRLMIVSCCVVFPLIMSLGMMMGTTLLQQWRQNNPQLMALNDVLNTWKAMQMPLMPKHGFPSEEHLGIFIAAHHRGVITNNAVWSGALARTFINGKARQFAESSLEKYASPSSKELAAAEASVKPLMERAISHTLPEGPGFLMVVFWSCLLLYVGMPAVIAALLFRGGLVLLTLGVTYLRRDGARASRLRLLWRSLVSWSPVLGAIVLSAMAIAVKSISLGLLGGLLVIGLTAWSLVLPGRGLQDRLAGTWPVPR